MSKRLMNAINSNTEDSETKKICEFFSDFIKTHSFLLTNGNKLQFQFESLFLFDHTKISIYHPTDRNISSTIDTTYSAETVKCIISKHGGKFKTTLLGDLVTFKKDKIKF